MIDLSLIIPAYNEKERLGPTIKSCYAFLRVKGISFEIIVVDDGSSDGTAMLVAGMKQQISQLSVISLLVNKGKGNAIRQGMLAANGRIRIFMDADGSTPIEETDKLLHLLHADEADVAIGSRYLRDSEVTRVQPKLRVAWSRLANRVVQRTLLPGIVDPHCGFKAFTAAAAQQIFPACTIDRWSFDLEVLAVARALRFRIAEVPVKWANDCRSKGKFSHLPRELYDFYRIRKRWAL